MVTSCGAERAILLVPCLKPNPAASAWTSEGSRWTSSRLLCPSDPGTLLINNTWRVLEGMMKQLNIDKLHLKRKCRITALQRSKTSVALPVCLWNIYVSKYLSVHPCSNPPPPVPHGKLSQRRCSLSSKDNSDKPADVSFQGITGTRRASSHRGNASQFVSAAAPAHLLPPDSLRSSGRSSLQPAPQVWRADEQHGMFDVLTSGLQCTSCSFHAPPPSSVSPVGSTAELSAKQHSHQVAARHWKWGRVAFDSHFQELVFGK